MADDDDVSFGSDAGDAVKPARATLLGDGDELLVDSDDDADLLQGIGSDASSDALLSGGDSGGAGGVGQKSLSLSGSDDEDVDKMLNQYDKARAALSSADASTFDGSCDADLEAGALEALATSTSDDGSWCAACAGLLVCLCSSHISAFRQMARLSATI